MMPFSNNQITSSKTLPGTCGKFISLNLPFTNSTVWTKCGTATLSNIRASRLRTEGSTSIQDLTPIYSLMAVASTLSLCVSGYTQKKAKQKKKAAGVVSGGLFRSWLPTVDNLRNFLRRQLYMLAKDM